MTETDTQKRVEEFIKTHPGNRTADIAHDLNISLFMARYHCKELAYRGKIRLEYNTNSLRAFPLKPKDGSE